ERGVDPAFMVLGLELATQMVLDLCGGTPSAIAQAGEPQIPEHIVEFPMREMKRMTGIEVAAAEFKRVLGQLGFFVAGQGPIVKIAVPSWRLDVSGKADIVEEIVRIIGVDRVPAVPFDRAGTARKPVLTPLQLRTR